MRSKKAVFNILSNLVLQIVVIIYGFIVPKIIITKYGSNVNGLISSITQFLAYISLLESGLGPVIMAALYKPIAKKDKLTIESILYKSETFFKKVAIIFVFYVIILCVFYPFVISDQYNKLYTISLVLIIAISTFAEYFFGITYKLYLQAEQKNYIISIIQILSYILSVLATIIMASIGTSIQILKFVSGLLFVARPIIQNLYVKKRFKLTFKNVDKNYVIKQKWNGFAQHIAAVIHASTDITILTLFCNLQEVSVYSVYYLVIKGIKALIQALSSGIDALFGNMIANNEKKNLTKKFDLYEFIYFTIVTILFSSTMVLIVPFITIYTNGITDANYIRQSFGYLIVISEYIWAVRQPFNILVKSAGHFKETSKGAWIEALSNIIISVILVSRMGITGVTIGTIIAMIIRSIEFVVHVNKTILNRKIVHDTKKIFIIIIETIVIVIASNKIPLLPNATYINWIINALIIFVLSTIVTIVVNSLIYKSEYKETLKIVKNLFHRKEEKHEQN